jgi:hypothetical protein
VAFSLYLDEDSVNRALIRALQARGMNVANAVDAGQVGTSDVAQLEYATAEERVLFTYNIGDFFSLHTSLLQDGRSHAGLILAPQQRYSVGEQVRRILRMSGERSAEDMQGRAEFLSGWGVPGPD